MPVKNKSTKLRRILVDLFLTDTLTPCKTSNPQTASKLCISSLKSFTFAKASVHHHPGRMLRRRDESKIRRIMRRKDKAIQTEEAIKLLTECEYGILSTTNTDGQPYGVPLNYVYRDNHIYFHCALTGHKIENITNNPKVSFCVIGDTKVIPSIFGTEYESVVAFGIASEIRGNERHNALLWLLEKYSPEYLEEGKEYIKKHDKVTKVIKIKVESFTGKVSPPKS